MSEYSSPLQKHATNVSSRISLLSSSPLRRTRNSRTLSSPDAAADGVAGASDDAGDRGALWAAVDELRSRVAVLELERASTRPADAHLVASLAQARPRLQQDVHAALERAAADIELLARKLAGTGDAAVQGKVDALYRSLSELLIVLSRPDDGAADTVVGIAGRLPARAASRMRSSLETQQLPPDMRPASRLATRSTTAMTASTSPAGSIRSMRSVGSFRSVGGHMHGHSRAHGPWSSPPVSRYRDAD